MMILIIFYLYSDLLMIFGLSYFCYIAMTRLFIK